MWPQGLPDGSLPPSDVGSHVDSVGPETRTPAALISHLAHAHSALCSLCTLVPPPEASPGHPTRHLGLVTRSCAPVGPLEASITPQWQYPPHVLSLNPRSAHLQSLL